MLFQPMGLLAHGHDSGWQWASPGAGDILERGNVGAVPTNTVALVELVGALGNVHGMSVWIMPRRNGVGIARL